MKFEIKLTDWFVFFLDSPLDLNFVMHQIFHIAMRGAVRLQAFLRRLRPHAERRRKQAAARLVQARMRGYAARVLHAPRVFTRSALLVRLADRDAEIAELRHRLGLGPRPPSPRRPPRAAPPHRRRGRVWWLRALLVLLPVCFAAALEMRAAQLQRRAAAAAVAEAGVAEAEVEVAAPVAEVAAELVVDASAAWAEPVDESADEWRVSEVEQAAVDAEEEEEAEAAVEAALVIGYE